MASTVALDLRMVSGTPHGIARYAEALWQRLPPDPAFRWAALVRPDAGVRPVRPGDRLLACRAPFLSPLEQVELPWLLQRSGVDVLHATSFSVPVGWRGPLVLTIHDVNHLALPGWTGPLRTPYWRRVVRPASLRAVRVITVSEFSAREIARWLAVPADRIRVAPDAVDPRFAPPPAAEVERLRARLALPTRHLLWLGSPKPHKNAELVFELARRLAHRAGGPPGASGRAALDIPVLAAAEGLPIPRGASLRLLPPVRDRDLPALYAGATLLLFPSLHEGFGLPPFEAAACGAPVLVAKGSAPEELWEGASTPLPPDQPALWVAEIERLLADEGARRALAGRCRRRAEAFRSWQPAVDAAVDAYRAALA